MINLDRHFEYFFPKFPVLSFDLETFIQVFKIILKTKICSFLKKEENLTILMAILYGIYREDI